MGNDGLLMATILGNLRGPDGERAHVVAGDGIVVTGTGADGDPYVVSLVQPPTVTSFDLAKRITPWFSGGQGTVTGTGLTQVGAWRLESGSTKVALELSSTTDESAVLKLRTAVGATGAFDLVGYADSTYAAPLVTLPGATVSVIPVLLTLDPTTAVSTVYVTVTVDGTDLDIIKMGRLVWNGPKGRLTNVNPLTITETSFTINLNPPGSSMKANGPWTLGWVRTGIDPSSSPLDAETTNTLTVT